MANFKRWLLLWEKLKLREDPKKVYDKLVRLYTGCHRAYHNLSHIEDGFKEFNQARHLFQDVNAAEMAWWLHDVIHDTEFSNNERESAHFAYCVLEKLGLPRVFIDKVYDLILVTTHQTIPEEIDAQLITDIDLVCFGKPKKEFEENTLKIRQEYVLISKEEFNKGRALVLLDFLKRPSIYSTDFFRKKYEKRARKNLIRSIKQLGHAYLLN